MWTRAMTVNNSYTCRCFGYAYWMCMLYRKIVTVVVVTCDGGVVGGCDDGVVGMAQVRQMRAWQIDGNVNHVQPRYKAFWFYYALHLMDAVEHNTPRLHVRHFIIVSCVGEWKRWIRWKRMKSKKTGMENVETIFK